MSSSRYHSEIIPSLPRLTTHQNSPKPARHLPRKKIKKAAIFLALSILLFASAGFISLQIQKLSLNCLDRYLLIDQKEKYAQICSKLTLISSAPRVVHDINLVRASVSPLFNSLFSSGRFSQQSLNSIQSSLERLNKSTSDLDEQLLLTPLTRQTPAYFSISRKISRLRQTINQLVQLSPQLARLLAVNSRSSFLVLIQDPTELRSSGGLIDTLAYFTLINSHLASSRYFSTSSLTTTSPSPQIWQQITRQSTWQIRDFSFEPNFPSSAKEVARLFTKTTSLPVDYVIAVNLSTLEKILGFTGPISLPELSDPVTSQNLVPTYLSHISRTGSRNLFISSLAATLSSRIHRLPVHSQIEIFYYLLSQLQSRQTFITPVSAPWDGSLSPPSCPFSPCLSDFLIPVENHIGLNKSSAYITRTATLSHSLSKNHIESEYQLSISNNSSSSVWPAGTTKNYFQLFLPSTASIDSVNMEHSISQRSGFNVISLLMDIPPGQTRRLLVRYRQPFSEDLSRYRFTYLPQPGLLNYSFTHILNYPPGWSVATHQVPAVAQPGLLRYNSPNPEPYILDLDLDTNP